MNVSYTAKTDVCFVLYIRLLSLHESLFLKVLSRLIIFTSSSLRSLCKSVFPFPLLLIFRHNSKLNLFDFNPDIVIYFVSQSTILRALIYTISWLCRKYRIANQIEWDSSTANMRQVYNYTLYCKELNTLCLALCMKCERGGSDGDMIMMTCQLQFVEPHL
jgi:hypothetical protein